MFFYGETLMSRLQAPWFKVICVPSFSELRTRFHPVYKFALENLEMDIIGSMLAAAIEAELECDWNEL